MRIGSKGFTDGKPFQVTQKDCELAWNGAKNGKSFRRYFCGHKFVPGDIARWQFTNDIAEAWGNPMVCEKCDDTPEALINKWKAMHEEAKGRMWWFCEKE